MKLSEVKVGDTLVVAGNKFACLNNCEIVIVEKDNRGLYVYCCYGHHWLIGDGQGNLLGFERKEDDKT